MESLSFVIFYLSSCYRSFCKLNVFTFTYVILSSKLKFDRSGEVKIEKRGFFYFVKKKKKEYFFVVHIIYNAEMKGNRNILFTNKVQLK